MTIKVDLLPTERKRFTFDPMMGFLLVFVILAVVGFAFHGIQLQNTIEAEKKELVTVEEEIKQIEQSLPVIEDLRSQITKLEEEIRVIESLVYDPIRYGNLLAELGRVLPPNVWLTTLAIEPGTQSITMAGTAAKVQGGQPLATIAAMMGNLDKSPFFSGSSLSSTQQQKIPFRPIGAVGGSDGVGYSFQIEARYDAEYAAMGAREGAQSSEGGAEGDQPPAEDELGGGSEAPSGGAGASPEGN